MAKLFANKFNLDQLPDPVKPKAVLEQAENIRIEPVEQKSINTQALNEQLRTVDNQKSNIPTSDQILERQGVKKSSATQYVSATKVERFSDKPINQGTVQIKKPKESEEKTSNIVLDNIKYGSVIVDPKVTISKVSQGDKITDPNINVQKQLFEDKTTNPNLNIIRVDGKTKVTNPNVEITKTAVGDKITDPNIATKKVRVSEIIKAPKITIKKAKKDEFIVDPNIIITKTQGTTLITNPGLDIQKVKSGDRITNPNTVVNKVEAGDRITNPNTAIKKVQADEKITNPNIEIQSVKVGDRITNPNIKIVRLTANELITDPKLEISKVVPGDRVVDPKTIISKVAAGDRITMPKMVLSQMKITDVRSYQPDLTGNGNTKLFPRTINLENRLKQALLGSTKHLPEYILSDQNTGYITISNPKVVAKISAINIQRVQYEKFVLKQGGIEDILKGIVSYFNPFKFGTKPPKQGSITIKNNQRFVRKTSPVDIKKLSTLTRITDPNTIINKIQVGDRIVDPKIQVNKDGKVEIIVDPKIQVELPKANVTKIPQIKTTKSAKIGTIITNPDIKVKSTSKLNFIIVPKIKPKQPKSSAEITIIPTFRISKFISIGVTNPRTPIAKVKVGERTVDPKIQPNIVRPGSRTTIPSLVLPEASLIGNVKDPQTRVINFEPTDDKKSTAKDVPAFGSEKINKEAVFPGDSNSISANGEIVQDAQYDPTAIFPSNNGSVPQFVAPTGVSYSNKYSIGSSYVYNNQDSALKKAGEAPTPTLTVTYYDGSAITQQKTVNTPQATNSDPSQPGGYRALSYSQIQARAKSNKRNLDYTYTEATAADEQNVASTKLGMPSTGADKLNTSIQASGTDFVNIKIVSGRAGDGSLQFRSFLKTFSDSISPNYSDVNYIGRPDTLKVFKNTTRSVSLGFVVPAFSKDELSVIYAKLNKLIQIAATGKLGTTSYVDGPFLRVTVGNWLNNTPAIASSIKYDTNPTEYSWDINAQMPHIVDVSLDLTILSSNNGNTFLSDGTYINYGG